MTLNLEYHYHEAGFNGSQWNNFFNVGRSNVFASNQFWYTQAFASDQQEPMSRQEIFARVSWNDAFIQKLQLSAFTFINLYDGSTSSQAAATYYLNDAWTVGALVGANLGGTSSEHGSALQAVSGILQVVRYF